MSRSPWNWLPAVLLAGAVGAWLIRDDTQPVRADAAQAAPSNWEYQTASVDLSALTTKLGELGKQGWEVINIISIDTMVDQTPDGKTHILTQRVEVTSRKPR
jgi:hypothetical protein